MDTRNATNKEVALSIARAVHAWRISPQGGAVSQVELARRSGIGLTPYRRFEKTGAITLRNLIAVLRTLDLLDRLETLIPEPGGPSPIELLAAERTKPARQRAGGPRTTAGKENNRG